MIDQGLEATGLKTKTIVHKSAAPIYAAAVTWVLYALLFPCIRWDISYWLRRRLPWWH